MYVCDQLYIRTYVCIYCTCVFSVWYCPIVPPHHLQIVAQVIVDTCLEHPYPDECSLTDIRLVIYDPMVYKRFEEYFVQRKRELEASLEETGLIPEGRKRANT